MTRAAVGLVGVIARREILVKLRDKAFLGTTVFLLLLVTAATVIPVLLQQRTPELRIAAQGEAAVETAELAAELGRQAHDGAETPVELGLLGPRGLPPAEVEVVAVDADTDVERMVRDGDVDAAVVGERLDALRLVGGEGVPPEVDLLVRAASGQLQVSAAAQEGGLSPEQVAALTSPAPPDVELLDALPVGSVPPELLVLVFAFLFYLSVLTFGMSIAQSVVEEKQSRVVELLVAAVPVRVLLAGKVIGNTIMAVGQVVIIVGGGLLGAALAGQSAVVAQLLGASGWFVLFFVLGFVMLAGLWAVGGSLASRVEDLQSTTVLMQVLVIVPFFAAIFAMDPGPTQRLLSYVPFTAPLLMPARLVLGNAEPWEPVVAALLVLASAVVFVLVAARLYEGSVLRTSGRTSTLQAWRDRAARPGRDAGAA
jgi:ABC-2 type transport system permease protein